IRAAAAARRDHRGRPARLPAPHALHDTRRLPLPRATAALPAPPAEGSGGRALPGGPRLTRRTRPSPVSLRRGRGAPRRMAALSGAVRLLAVLGLGAGLAGCPSEKVESKQAPARPTVPVAVAAVEQKTVPLQLPASGTGEASTIDSVKAQVGGERTRIHIKEGQDVKKGDLLFTIDPRAYEAALAQAEANLARDRGQIQQAKAVLERDG